MNLRRIFPVLLLVASLHGQAKSSEPNAALLPPIETSTTEAGEKKKAEPLDKNKKIPEEKKVAEAPRTDLFDQGNLMGPQFPTGFNPQMMGDFGLLLARQNVAFHGFQTITKQTTILVEQGSGPPAIHVSTSQTTVPITQTRTLLVPFGVAFKVAENESPRPTDRVFGFYNNFGGVTGLGSSASFSSSSSSIQQILPIGSGSTFVTTKTDIRTVVPGQTFNGSLNREVYGFEKTFLDGQASIEVRVPTLQANSGFNNFNAQYFGDLTVIGKYAFLLDNTTGNVISGGLAISAPTGASIDTVTGPVHPTLFQPWFGYIRNFDNFYIQGIHSIVVPTDPRFGTLLFNDIGINYWLYRARSDRFLSFVVPMCEVHVTTPMNNSSQDGALFVPNQVVMTGGVHFGIRRNTTLSLGVATPVTSPRLFGVESVVQLNWRF